MATSIREGGDLAFRGVGQLRFCKVGFFFRFSFFFGFGVLGLRGFLGFGLEFTVL